MDFFGIFKDSLLMVDGILEGCSRILWGFGGSLEVDWDFVLMTAKILRILTDP